MFVGGDTVRGLGLGHSFPVVFGGRGGERVLSSRNFPRSEASGANADAMLLGGAQIFAFLAAGADMSGASGSSLSDLSLRGRGM